jgi:quinol monooxygenase YgiN
VTADLSIWSVDSALAIGQARSIRQPPEVGSIMSVDVVINFQALPGRAAELLGLLAEGRDLSRNAQGCESFELYQREDDENKFMFLERWASIESHHDNMATNIVASGHLARILPLVVGPPDNGVIQLVK